MKVLHVTNRLNEGGVDTLLYQLLTQLKSKSVDVDILVLDPHSVSIKAQFQVKEIRMFVSKYQSLYNPLNILQVCDYMKSYDIIHSHLFPSQYYVALATKISKSSTLIVTTEHVTTNKRRKLKFIKPLEIFIYNQYASIIGVSNAASQNLTKWIGSDRVKTITNGIDLELIYTAKPFYLNKSISDKTNTIVMVARFFGQKDHKTAIRAMKYLPISVHLIFVGSGETLINCKELSVSLGVHERVHFLGHRTDVANIIKGGTICMLSSYYEGLSIAVIEYLAAGKAVIGTNIEGVKELISDKKLLFNIGDEKALAKAAMLLLNNEKYRIKIEKENYIRSKDFNLSKMTNEYLIEYMNLITVKNQ
jgi:glycosyltransferase involved in cell wall biosynthesis